MELEMLKEKWTEMDSRLTQVELLNKKALQEIVKMKVGNNLRHLQTRATVSLVCNMLVILCLGPIVKSIGILSVESIWTLIIVIGLGFIWQVYRSTFVLKMKMDMPTAELLKYTLKEQRAATIDKFVLLPMVLIGYVMFFFFERGWIIERGKVTEALLLLVAMIVVASFAFVANYRRYNTFLKEISGQIKEIEE